MTIFATSQAECKGLAADGLSVSVVDNLETLTGADFMVSPINIPPANTTFVERSLRAGAVLVQVKRGQDLPASIKDGRLYRSLARMQNAGASQSQAILLFIGSISERDGQAYINGTKVRLSGDTYWTIQSVITYWNHRGGTYSHIPKFSMTAAWFSMMQRQVIEMKDKPTVVYHKPPLQIVQYENDWRATLLSFPGLGTTKVDRLFDEMMEHNPERQPTLKEALMWITTPNLARLAGIGKADVAKIRAWLGMVNTETVIFTEFPIDTRAKINESKQISKPC